MARFPLPSPIDLALTLAPLRHGRDDPTIRFASDGIWIARATAAGPAALRLAVEARMIVAEAWGPGAQLAIEAAPGLAGLLDDPSRLVAQHPLIRELARRFSTLRLPRTGQLLPALIQAVIEQKVTASEAHGAYVGLAHRLGEPAPGTAELLLPPAGARLAALPYFEFHPLGLERRRAELLRRIGGSGARIESWTALSPEEARARLQAIPGIGPWTAAEATPISPTWSRGLSPANLAPTTRGCSRSSPRTPANAPGLFGCSRFRASRSRVSAHGSRHGGSPGSSGDVAARSGPEQPRC